MLTSHRQKMLQNRRALTPAFRQQAGLALSKLLFSDPLWLAAKTIGCYISMSDEMPTDLIVKHAFEMGKKIAVPRIHSNLQTMDFCLIQSPEQLVKGPLGIYQPSQTEIQTFFASNDCLIIPGVAFDLQGNRMGMGKGFYDRYLSGCPAHRLGLAFECQIISTLPVTPTDIPMEKIITEKRIIQPGNF